MRRFQGLPDECWLGVTAHVSNRDYSGRQRAMVLEDMVKKAAHFIKNEGKITEQEGDYSSILRLEVLVINPEDFYQIVQEEAMRMYSDFRMQIKPVTKEE